MSIVFILLFVKYSHHKKTPSCCQMPFCAESVTTVNWVIVFSEQPEHQESGLRLAFTAHAFSRLEGCSVIRQPGYETDCREMEELMILFIKFHLHYIIRCVCNTMQTFIQYSDFLTLYCGYNEYFLIHTQFLQRCLPIPIHLCTLISTLPVRPRPLGSGCSSLSSCVS